MNKAITFEDFQPGALMGEAVLHYDAELAERWQRIFGSSAQDGAQGAAEGASLAIVMMMRAYLSIVAPRPPGNVHARQQFSLATPPKPGEAIRTVVTCAHKEIKRERRHVTLETRATGEGGRAIYRGRMKLIWAA